MKRLKNYMSAGTVFVIILGTLAHFFYEWSHKCMIAGLFTPVNESTWEHMKLVFFPMLLFSLFAVPKLKKAVPSITSALLSGVLFGTALIPVLFYTYTGILGRSFFILDMGVFVLSVIAAFYTAYRLTLSCKMQSQTLILFIAVGIVLACFLLFTYLPPKLGIFIPPHFG